MIKMSYTYLEIKHLQLFAKSALIDEIIEMLKAEAKKLDGKHFKSGNYAEIWTLGAKFKEVSYIIKMLKAKKKEIKAQIAGVQDQMEIDI